MNAPPRIVGHAKQFIEGNRAIGRIAEGLRPAVARPARFHDPTWSPWFRINSRMVSRLKVGRLLLGRDAAHIRPRYEHGHPGHDQPVLEARDGDEWASAFVPPRHLRPPFAVFT